MVGGRGDDPVIVDNFGGLKRQARVWTAVLSVIMLFAALLVGATGAQMAAADDSPSPSASESSSPSALVEDSQGYITDPQNLLGDNLTKVIDAANRTKQETGVTVRLLYLESFNTTEKPEQWASQLLESLNPPANTVMLAVASHDGNLVVVVSPNSDEWLRSQSTVDQLSEAASKPLLDQQAGQGPNWSQSAIDMMDAIASAKSTATTHAVSSVSIIVMIIVFVVLIVVVLVMIFMAVYYMRSGIIANISLLVNAILILGALAAFDVTLTLPGIAGIILTIGMAVDANVLIYERIREEIESKKTVLNAIDLGFDRAYSAIFDSNITTLVVAVILLWQGTGAIKGFAITLAIGVFTTLFTAVFLTRLLFDTAFDKFPGSRINRYLAGSKNKSIHFNGLTVRADGSRCRFRV